MQIRYEIILDFDGNNLELDLQRSVLGHMIQAAQQLQIQDSSGRIIGAKVHWAGHSNVGSVPLIQQPVTEEPLIEIEAPIEPEEPDDSTCNRRNGNYGEDSEELHDNGND